MGPREVSLQGELKDGSWVGSTMMKPWGRMASLEPRKMSLPRRFLAEEGFLGIKEYYGGEKLP